MSKASMIPGASVEAAVTCERINQWLDGQRALTAALRSYSAPTGCSLQADNVTETVRPARGEVTR